MDRSRFSFDETFSLVTCRLGTPATRENSTKQRKPAIAMNVGPRSGLGNKRQLDEMASQIPLHATIDLAWLRFMSFALFFFLFTLNAVVLNPTQKHTSRQLQKTVGYIIQNVGFTSDSFTCEVRSEGDPHNTKNVRKLNERTTS